MQPESSADTHVLAASARVVPIGYAAEPERYFFNNLIDFAMHIESS